MRYRKSDGNSAAGYMRLYSDKMVSQMIDKMGWDWTFFRKCDILTLQMIGDSVSFWTDAGQVADKQRFKTEGENTCRWSEREAILWAMNQ